MPTKPDDRLYLCLHIPNFYLQALTRQRTDDHTSIVILDGVPPLETVVAINDRALAKGLHCGISLVEASRFADLEFIRRSIDEEVSTKHLLTQFALRFTPLVEDDSQPGECTLVLDIRASLAIFGDAQLLGHKLSELLSSIGMHGTLAVSRNLHTAVCIARSSLYATQCVVIPDGSEQSFLSPIFTSILPMTKEEQMTLTEWGIHTLDDLSSLPLNELITRFGQRGKVLFDMSRGEYNHHFTPMAFDGDMCKAIDFDTPVDMIDSLLFSISSMLIRLVERADSELTMVSSISIHLMLEKLARDERIIRTAVPTNDTAVWLKLIHLDLKTRSPLGPVVGIAMKVERGRSSKIQLGLFSPQLPEPSRLDVTLARISAILGTGCTGSALLVDSHSRDAFTLNHFTLPNHSFAPSSIRSRPFVRFSLRRIRPSCHITLYIESSAPHSFTWNAISYLVLSAYGPWKNSISWWSACGVNQYDWDVAARRADTNSLICCSISQNQVDKSWYLNGIYD